MCTHNSTYQVHKNFHHQSQFLHIRPPHSRFLHLSLWTKYTHADEGQYRSGMSLFILRLSHKISCLASNAATNARQLLFVFRFIVSNKCSKWRVEKGLRLRCGGWQYWFFIHQQKPLGEIIIKNLWFMGHYVDALQIKKQTN